MNGRMISVVGLGYAGLPVAVAFGKIHKTIGFDVNSQRIREPQHGFDRTGEVEREELETAQVLFTHRVEDLREADFHIVAVPTPIDGANRPDLSPLLALHRSWWARRSSREISWSTSLPSTLARRRSSASPFWRRSRGSSVVQTSQSATVPSGSTPVTRSIRSPESLRLSPDRIERP